MVETGRPRARQQQRNNGVVFGACLAFVVGMVGMSYAAVPLYRMFCQVTGYNGTTKNQIVIYSVLMSAAAVAPYFTGLASLGYGIFSGLLSIVFIVFSIAVWRMPDGDEKMLPARKLFGYSIFYLFAVFLALMVDHYVPTVMGFVGGLL